MSTDKEATLLVQLQIKTHPKNIKVLSGHKSGLETKWKY